MKPFSQYYYLLSLLLPVTTLVSLIWGWYWFLLPLSHIIIYPICELLFWKSQTRIGWSGIIGYILYAHVLLQISIWWLFLFKMWTVDMPFWLEFFYIFNVWASSSISALLVAHEFGHKKWIFAYISSIVLLWTVHYTHFYFEHNFAHHAHVGTKKDSATAQRGEKLPHFYLRSIPWQYMSAWRVASTLKKQNILIWFHAIYILSWWVIYFIWWWWVILDWLLMSGIAILYLEYSNYLQHWGIERTSQQVKSIHSWQSSHIFIRAILLDLPLHADHHTNASRVFWVLEYVNPGRELKYGYFTNFWFSLFFPSRWQKMMCKKL